LHKGQRCGHHRIALRQRAEAYTVNNSVYGPTGLPVICSDITVVGNNSTIRRPGTAPDVRILAVGKTGHLRLQDDPDIGTVTGGNFNFFGYRRLTDQQAVRGFTPGPTDITASSNDNIPTRLRTILNTTLADTGGRTKTQPLQNARQIN